MESITVDTNEFKTKDDGMHLIAEVPFSLDDLRMFISQTRLVEKCAFIENCEDIEEVCPQNFSLYLKFLKFKFRNFEYPNRFANLSLHF